MCCSGVLLMGVAPRIPGSSKTNLEYMGALTQNGNAGDMDKSIICKGHTTYLVFAGIADTSHSKADVTATSGEVSRAFQDTASVYSSYLNSYTNAAPSLVAWKIENCKKGDTTIKIKCPGYVFLAFFVYGV